MALKGRRIDSLYGCVDKGVLGTSRKPSDTMYAADIPFVVAAMAMAFLFQIHIMYCLSCGCGIGLASLRHYSRWL